MRRIKKRHFILAAVLLLAFQLAIDLYSSTSGPADGPHRPVHVPATIYVQHDIVVDGMRLRYIDEGSGPPIILLGGHTSRLEEYEGLVGALRGQFRVLVFDMPGSGYSDKPDRDYDLRFFEDTVLHFMDALGIERCGLAGGSLGGNLSVRLAARAPERVTRIFAWSPAGAWKRKPALVAVMRIFCGRTLFWPVVKIQSTYWHRDSWPGREAELAETFAYYKEVMSPRFVKMYWGIAADQLDHSLFDIAGTVRRPTLLAVGELDNGFDLAAGIRRLHREIPGSELIVFEDTGHAIAVEQPERLAAALIEFFSRPDDPPLH